MLTALTFLTAFSLCLLCSSSSGGGFPGGTADPLLQFGASDEELLNTVVLPGLNLLFDGRLLLPLDISQYLQGHSAPSGLR